MKINNLSIIISLALFTLIFMIYNNVSEELTTKSYIATTYMYIFFAFLFIILVNEENLIPDLKYGIKFMAVAILMIILVVSLSFIDPKKQLIKHIVWIALIWTIAIVFNPIYNYTKNENILNKVLFTVGAMFLVMTYFAYTKPVTYFDSLEPYLISGLIGILISRLVNIIFSDFEQPSGFFGRDLIISIISVVLFNGFLLYDTQKILKEGLILDQICKGEDNMVCADYPIKSMNIILDLINLFTNTARLYSNK
jgi:FtsH-binding integral membrane protein